MMDSQRKNIIQEAEVIDGYELLVFNELFIPYDELDIPQKPRINPITSTLDLKILENAPCIVIRIGINIYSGDPQKARIF